MLLPALLSKHKLCDHWPVKVQLHHSSNSAGCICTHRRVCLHLASMPSDARRAVQCSQVHCGRQGRSTDVTLLPAACRHAARGLVRNFISRAEDKVASAARLRRTMPSTALFFMQLQLAADESGRLEAFELAMKEAVQRACQEEDVFSSMMATCLAGMPAANDSMLELLMQLLYSEVQEQLKQIMEAAQQGAPEGMVRLETDIYQQLGGRDQEAAVPGAWSGAAWGAGAMTAEEVMEKNVRMWVPDLTGSGSERLESYERQLMRRVSSRKREDDNREMLD